jgi:hypothetical protein
MDVRMFCKDRMHDGLFSLVDGSIYWITLTLLQAEFAIIGLHSLYDRHTQN